MGKADIQEQREVCKRLENKSLQQKLKSKNLEYHPFHNFQRKKSREKESESLKDWDKKMEKAKKDQSKRTNRIPPVETIRADNRMDGEENTEIDPPTP